LPNTGAGSGVVQLAAMGILALVIGATVLVRERRRTKRTG
jgi:LPXTG-motif cell wall-anchored protein